MSKHVKYISSEHYGAPQLLGDQWGYGVQVLRKCLCEGFNERIDITDIEVLDKDHVKITYVSPHRYVSYQTIAVKGSDLFELNNEYFIESVTELTVTAKSYIDLTSLLNLKLAELSTVSSKVAPLGFIEKFRDGNKSAFTTDEEEAFFVIDDTQPTAWNATAASTPLICPIVYMTDKMTDINTDGKYIVPFDNNNPTWYKLQNYKDGTINKNGLWNFITVGTYTSGGNQLAHRSIPTQYDIIGNGRIFYFMPSLNYNSLTDKYSAMYIFGKINNDYNTPKNKHYILHSTGNYGADMFSNTRLNPTYIMAPTNVESNNIFKDVSIGKVCNGLLCDNLSTKHFLYLPTINMHVTSGYNISGGIGNKNISYPDFATLRYYTSSVYINNKTNMLGKLSGLRWVYNADNIIHKNRNIYKYKQLDGKYNLFYCYKTDNVSNSSSNTTVVYNLSLNNKDWYNYD